MIDYTNAISSLYPDATWILDGDNYEGLIWTDKKYPKPSLKQLQTRMAELQAIEDSLAYQRLRAKEYPPITDYLDAVVKNDQAQIDAYIAACQAVKNKYPKPEGV